MLTRSMSMSSTRSRRRRSHLRLPIVSTTFAWIAWQRRHSALMVARLDQMRADHVRRYRPHRCL